MKKCCLLSCFILVLLSGCSKDKTLKCTYKDNQDLANVTNTFKYTFDEDGKEIKRLNIKVVYDYSDKYVSLLNANGDTLESKNSQKELCKVYLNDINAKCNVKVKKNKVTINVESTIKDNNKESYNGTYDSLKKSYESYGYKCK